jgi:two-component system response regulator AtoC
VTRTAAEISSLLVVSSDSVVLRSISLMGASNSWEFETAFNAWDAMDRVQAGATPDLLVLDLPQGDSDGLHILRWMRRLRPTLPIILIGHPGDAGKEQESNRMGARDYLIRPIEDRQLEIVIQRSLCAASEGAEADITSDDVEAVGDDSYFIGCSSVMRGIRAQAALLAAANVPVLILGESGTGKETTGRLIHKLSVRSGFEFAKVNCAALPEDLLEHELFGYERVSASGPARIKRGKLEFCAKGTILLEEITEMPLALQLNLLQVLKNKSFVRPGTSVFIEADVRILASSGVKVQRAVSEKRLREDLYHHLSAYTIHVPPLRDRKEELPFLSRHFMHRLAKHYGLTPRDLSPAINHAWQAYNWPGNLRELEHLVKRYLMVGDKELTFEKNGSDQKHETHRMDSTKGQCVSQFPASSSGVPVGAAGSESLRSLVQSVKSEAERNAIAVALEKTGWNRKAAARLLNVSYRTVLYKIEQYQMHSSDSPSFPRANGHRTGTAGLRDDRKEPASLGAQSMQSRQREPL